MAEYVYISKAKLTKVKKDLKLLLDYCEPDEKKHYEEVDGNYAWQEVHCHCGECWTDIYKLVDVERRN